MEIRKHVIEVEQVKLYILIMNDMRDPKIEMCSIVAVSTSLEALQRWEHDQRAPEQWRDGRYNKTYSHFTDLEWKNPVSMDPDCLDIFGQGVKIEWIDIRQLEDIMHNNNWIFVNEDY